ncbi:uncharacterized protein PG998_009685 [Apiospora kogelbergensis]|uniref:Uncharacterized protein n=1 Tax=Apiospora kogelbergensis TaxID=1337665 RepID=A0AAW0R8C8_9PEZI
MPRIRFSPYGPRPRRSARLVLVWMAVLSFILFVTYYLKTRQQATAMSEPLAEGLLLHDKAGGSEALRNKIRPPKANHGMEQ